VDDAERKELTDRMRLSVLDGDEEEARVLAKLAVETRLDPVVAMDEGFLQGIRQAGELYEIGDFYLPELVCSADAMKAAMAILDPELKKSGAEPGSGGRIVLATVQGDIHDIGKTIVGTMLTAAGFDVRDLGADVPNERLVEAVRDLSPDVLGMSALLTTTMEEQRNVIGLLEREKLRSGLKVIIGGAPASRDWAAQIKADGYSDNAMDAVRLVRQLLGRDAVPAETL